MLKRYIGSGAFYKKVLIVAIPLIIQQLITSFVNMLDNIMVGQMGTLPMSAVSVANQLILVFNLAVFGSVAAASIFGAQYAGKEDWDGVRFCLRYKLVAELLIIAAGACIFLGFGPNLIRIFLNPETNDAASIAQTLDLSMSYLRIMVVGFIPFALSQALSSAIRETGNTRLPMISSITAVVVNLIGNYILIFGKFGAPALGSNGAAIATVISRFVELCVIIGFAVTHKEKLPFFKGIFKHFHVPGELVKNITIKGIPLMANEILWSIGLAAVTRCYSVRGIDALAAVNISSTITNLFFVINFAMGDAISILVGQKLGAGETEEAVDTDRKMIAFAWMCSVCLGLVLFATAHYFPQIYKTSDEIRANATQMLRYGGLCMWIGALYNASYFTMRCGGKTVITFLFDSVSMIVVSFPVAYCLAEFTSMRLPYMYLTLQLVDLYKVVLGLFLVHKRVWVNNLVG